MHNRLNVLKQHEPNAIMCTRERKPSILFCSCRKCKHTGAWSDFSVPDREVVSHFVRKRSSKGPTFSTGEMSLPISWHPTSPGVSRISAGKNLFLASCSCVLFSARQNLLTVCCVNRDARVFRSLNLLCNYGTAIHKSGGASENQNVCEPVGLSLWLHNSLPCFHYSSSSLCFRRVCVQVIYFYFYVGRLCLLSSC
jgi:hypothetical protein